MWGFLAGHRSGRRSVQNPCTPIGAASCRLVMNTPSEEVPNSISNHTLQAMLAARRGGEATRDLERPVHAPNEEGVRKAPTFDELKDLSFQKLMVEMSAFKRLVESGAISGFEADAWKKVTAEEA